MDLFDFLWKMATRPDSYDSSMDWLFAVLMFLAALLVLSRYMVAVLKLGAPTGVPTCILHSTLFTITFGGIAWMIAVGVQTLR